MVFLLQLQIVSLGFNQVLLGDFSRAEILVLEKNQGRWWNSLGALIFKRFILFFELGDFFV